MAEIEDATVTFFEDIGRFVTGGGWVPNPGASGNGKGNFGFVGKYNRTAAQRARWFTSIAGRTTACRQSSLGFSGGPSYPLSATVQGKGASKS